MSVILENLKKRLFYKLDLRMLPREIINLTWLFFRTFYIVLAIIDPARCINIKNVWNSWSYRFILEIFEIIEYCQECRGDLRRLLLLRVVRKADRIGFWRSGDIPALCIPGHNWHHQLESRWILISNYSKNIHEKITKSVGHRDGNEKNG